MSYRTPGNGQGPLKGPHSPQRLGRSWILTRMCVCGGQCLDLVLGVSTSSTLASEVDLVLPGGAGGHVFLTLHSTSHPRPSPRPSPTFLTITLYLLPLLPPSSHHLTPFTPSPHPVPSLPLSIPSLHLLPPYPPFISSLHA